MTALSWEGNLCGSDLPRGPTQQGHQDPPPPHSHYLKFTPLPWVLDRTLIHS